MSITYEWTIEQLKTKDIVNDYGETLTDAVVQVVWKKIGTDADGNSSPYVGVTNLDFRTVRLADFVSYASLTQQNVIDWIEAAYNQKQWDGIHGIIENKIKKKGAEVKDLPW